MREPRTVLVDLYQGDDQQLLADALLKKRVAQQEASEPRRGNARTGDDDDPQAEATEAETEYADVLKRVNDRMTHARVRQVGRTKWREAIAKHKPREDNKQDERAGFNTETFPPAAIDLCLVEVIENDEVTKLSGNEREEWIDDLGEGETTLVFEAAFHLNERQPTSPKALPLVGQFDVSGR